MVNIKEFDNPNYNFSEFQLCFIEETEKNKTFKKWVQANLINEVRKKHPLAFLWYTTDDKLHLRRVGLNRFLSEVVTS